MRRTPPARPRSPRAAAAWWARRRGPDHDVIAAHLAARLDDEPVEVRELGRGPRGDRRQERLLVEKEAHEVVDVRVHELVIGHARAGRVDDRHGPAHARLDQQLERGPREAILVGALVDDVHATRAAIQPRDDAAIAQLEVRRASPPGRTARDRAPNAPTRPRRRDHRSAAPRAARRRETCRGAPAPGRRRRGSGQTAAGQSEAGRAGSPARRSRRRAPRPSAPGPRSPGSDRPEQRTTSSPANAIQRDTGAPRIAGS